MGRVPRGCWESLLAVPPILKPPKKSTPPLPPMGLDGYTANTAVLLHRYDVSVDFLSNLWRQVQGGDKSSRRHTSMAHEEATLQSCRSAAAVEVACSPLKTCLQSYLQSRRLGGGLHPARTHAATKARCAPRLRPGLRNRFDAPRSEVRGLYLYGTCFPKAASVRSKRRTASWGRNR